MPSCCWACVRPWLASWLNDRSLRPPMSVTRPTLIFFWAGVDDAEPEPPDELLLSLEPQPAATSPQRQRVRATSRCTVRRAGIVVLLESWMGAAGGGGSLIGRPVDRLRDPGEDAPLEPIVGERALHGRTRDVHQRPL